MKRLRDALTLLRDMRAPGRLPCPPQRLAIPLVGGLLIALFLGAALLLGGSASPAEAQSGSTSTVSGSSTVATTLMCREGWTMVGARCRLYRFGTGILWRDAIRCVAGHQPNFQHTGCELIPVSLPSIPTPTPTPTPTPSSGSSGGTYSLRLTASSQVSVALTDMTIDFDCKVGSSLCTNRGSTRDDSWSGTLVAGTHKITVYPYVTGSAGTYSLKVTVSSSGGSSGTTTTTPSDVIGSLKNVVEATKLDCRGMNFALDDRLGSTHGGGSTTRPEHGGIDIQTMGRHSNFYAPVGGTLRYLDQNGGCGHHARITRADGSWATICHL